MEMVIANLNKNIQNAKDILRALVPALEENDACPCRAALKDAIITDPKRIPQTGERGFEDHYREIWNISQP